jgi:hypothetical protein
METAPLFKCFGANRFIKTKHGQHYLLAMPSYFTNEPF